MVTDSQTNRVHTVANDETAANVLIHHTMQMNEQVNYAFQFVQPLPADVDFRRRYQVSFHCYRCWFFLPCRLQVSKLNWNHLRILFHSPIISFVRFPPLHRGFTRVVIFWISALWKILFILSKKGLISKRFRKENMCNYYYYYLIKDSFDYQKLEQCYTVYNHNIQTTSNVHFCTYNWEFKTHLGKWEEHESNKEK